MLFRRGLQTNLPATPANGEPIWTTDQHRLFIGTGSGSVEFASLSSVSAAIAIALATAEAYTDSAISTEASARISGDSSTLSTAEAYTDSSIAALSIASYQLRSEKDAASGYAGLTAGGLLKAAEFPTPTVSTFGGVKDKAAVTSQFVTSIVNGIAVLAQPAYTDLTGTPQLAQTKNAVASNWIRSYDATTGLFTASQPAYSDISGTPQLAQTKAAITSNWLRSYDASTGLFTASQPAYSDLTGTPTLPATKALIASNYFTSYDSSTGLFTAAQPAFTDISGTASTGQIPNLPASKITSGQIALAQGGTNADLSATGGANKFLKQSSVGGTVTVAALVAGDVPTGIVTWDLLGNAAGALTLANAGNATTFNQTSAVSWTWANSTAATSGGTVSASPIVKLGYRVFTLGVDTAATWNIQAQLNPTTALSFTITNASENSNSDVVFTIGAHTLVIGNVVTFSGLTGTFTWMNNQTCYVDAIAATTITVRDATTHGTQGASNPGGTVTQQPISQLVFSTTGIPIGTDSFVHTAPEQRLIFPVCGGLANSSSGMGSFAFAGQSDFAGYGPLLASGGLAMYISAGASGSQWLTLYQRATAATNHLPNALGALSYGDNSAGNSTIWLSAVATNFSVSIVGANTTNTTNPAVHLGNIGNLTALSGNQIGVGVGVANGQGSPINAFVPVYGTATFQSLVNKYTVNQNPITGTIAGVQVVTNVVTLVFSNTLSATPMTAGATTLNVVAVTNTAVNTNPATISTVVFRAVSGTVTNSSETAGSVVTLNCTHAIVANDYCYISGLTVATWLNGKVVKITSVVANTSITFPDPTAHGTSASTAEGGGTVVTSYLTYSKVTGNITLTTDTGTALQQATGNTTGFLVNAIETAIGGTHLLVDLQAGAAGTTSKLSIINTGILSRYKGISTVGDGTSYEVATIDLTGQTAAIAATLAYTPTATGWYRLSLYLKVTTAAGTSSTLGGATGVTITYTDGTDSVAQSVVMSLTKQDGTVGINNAGNSTTTVLYGTISIYAKTAVAINYAIDYTSNAANAMAYLVRGRLEAL